VAPLLQLVMKISGKFPSPAATGLQALFEWLQSGCGAAPFRIEREARCVFDVPIYEYSTDCGFLAFCAVRNGRCEVVPR
jgi:hypothetical protein